MTIDTTNKKNVSESDEIELGRLIGELVDHRKLIIAVTSVFTLIASLYAIFATAICSRNRIIAVKNDTWQNSR